MRTVRHCLLALVAVLGCAAHAQNRPAVYALAFSPDGKKLAVGTHGRAIIYETAKWTVSDSVDGVQYAVRSLAFHPDGKRLAIGSGTPGVSGDLIMLEPGAAGKPIHYPPAKDSVECIAFSKEGASMAAASLDGKARYYEKTQVATARLLEEHNGRVTSVAFSPKPDYVFATGAMDKMVKIWEIKTQTVVVNFDQATAGITGLAFLPSGDQLVGASLDGNLYWWAIGYDEKQHTYSGSPVRTVNAHDGGVTAMSVSDNRERITTAGMDRRISVWKLDDGSLVHEFKGIPNPVYATALSPDGKSVAAGGRDGVVWVWEVESGKLLKKVVPPPARVDKRASR